MSKEITYDQYAAQFLTQLPRGAFLTVKAGEKINVMTIGWGSLGYIWQRPIMMVMVRQSRYTYQLMEEAADFSVSLPAPGELKQDLAIAGTKSGRDIDKFKESKLTAKNAREIVSPIIDECNLIYECRPLFKQIMEADKLSADIREKYYADNDLHVIYYAEILACYTRE